jgi:hypothetical protein
VYRWPPGIQVIELAPQPCGLTHHGCYTIALPACCITDRIAALQRCTLQHYGLQQLSRYEHNVYLGAHRLGASLRTTSRHAFQHANAVPILCASRMHH